MCQQMLHLWTVFWVLPHKTLRTGWLLLAPLVRALANRGSMV